MQKVLIVFELEKFETIAKEEAEIKKVNRYLPMLEYGQEDAMHRKFAQLQKHRQMFIKAGKVIPKSVSPWTDYTKTFHTLYSKIFPFFFYLHNFRMCDIDFILGMYLWYIIWYVC